MRENSSEIPLLSHDGESDSSDSVVMVMVMVKVSDCGFSCGRKAPPFTPYSQMKEVTISLSHHKETLFFL